MLLTTTLFTVVLAGLILHRQAGVAQELRQTMIDNIAHKTTVYGYDALDRLVDAQATSQAGATTERYVCGYDRNSNRTSETMTGTDVSGATTFTYGAANIIQSTSGGLTFTHEANGNLTDANNGTAAFVYNTRNQASSYTPFGGGPLAQNFLGEGQGERIGEGATRLQYSQLVGLGTRTDTAGTTYFTRDPNGRLIDERRPDGQYYYLFDGLGSTTGLTDSTGALVRTYRYEPYGTQLRLAATCGESRWEPPLSWSRSPAWSSRGRRRRRRQFQVSQPTLAIFRSQMTMRGAMVDAHRVGPPSV